MKAALPICKCCEMRVVSVSDLGLCAECGSHDVLVRAFSEGRVRLAETAARVVAEPELVP